MSTWQSKVGIALIPLIFLGAWYAWTKLQPSAESGVTFTKEGNLIQNNPGLAKNVWHLSYGEPGFPGLVIPLVFDTDSRCGVEGAFTRCDMSFQQGDRVLIQGVRVDEYVVVGLLTYVRLEERGIPIRLYFYNAEKDKDGQGNILCSQHGLVAVERIIPQTTMPLTESIGLLLRGEISDEERAEGVSSEFPLFGVRLKSATIQDGIATLTFDDPNNQTGGGSCRVGILWAQIEATARQFPSVKEVRFLPEELFQP